MKGCFPAAVLRPSTPRFSPQRTRRLRYRRSCIGNMTFQEAADLAGELRPGLVIPGHWDMFADNPGDPEAFADYLDAKYGGLVPCVIPRHLSPIRLEARSR